MSRQTRQRAIDRVEGDRGLIGCAVCGGDRITPVYWPDDDPALHDPSFVMVVGADDGGMTMAPEYDRPCGSCGRRVRVWM